MCILRRPCPPWQLSRFPRVGGPRQIRPSVTSSTSLPTSNSFTLTDPTWGDRIVQRFRRKLRERRCIPRAVVDGVGRGILRKFRRRLRWRYIALDSCEARSAPCIHSYGHIREGTQRYTQRYIRCVFSHIAEGGGRRTGRPHHFALKGEEQAGQEAPPRKGPGRSDPHRDGQAVKPGALPPTISAGHGRPWRAEKEKAQSAMDARKGGPVSVRASMRLAYGPGAPACTTGLEVCVDRGKPQTYSS